MSQKHKIQLRISSVKNADLFVAVKLKNIKQYISTIKKVDDHVVYMYYRKHIHVIQAATPNICSHIIDLALAIDNDEPKYIAPIRDIPKPDIPENWASIFVDDDKDNVRF